MLVAPLVVAVLGACAPESETLSASGSTIDDGTGESTGTHAGGGRKPAAVVKLEPTTFAPEKVQIEAGKRVLWKWDGGVQHNVNGGDEFKSELQSSGEFGHVFEEAGTYEYVCDVHPTTMKGTVEVVETSTTSAPPASSSTDY